MFLGEYKLKFSGKGRIVLPSKLREELGQSLAILSRGFEGCIFGFSPEGFEKEFNRQLEISATEERARYLRRYLFSGSVPVELDSQGRFVIPSALFLFAKLKEEVTIIGAGDHFEIWDQVNWQKHIKEVEDNYARVS